MDADSSIREERSGNASLATSCTLPCPVSVVYHDIKLMQCLFD